MTLTLLDVPGVFAVCRLPADSPLPAWATAGDLFSVTRTADELSVVCHQEAVPEGTQAEPGWRCVRVAGAMPFATVGVLAALVSPLARAGISVFAFSTFDTDYLMVKGERSADAVAALRAAGHTLAEMPPVADVRLRPVEADDLPQIFRWQSDPESNRMAATIPRTREAFDAHWAKTLPDPAVTARIILADDVPVGMTACFPRDGQQHVGYWIARPHWGRGIASRAFPLLLAEVARRPLVATAVTSNAASLRVLQKSGFRVVQVRHSPANDRHIECEEAVLVLGEWDSSCRAEGGGEVGAGE
jgi:RimJ/RimL family protein N-acetyltransferase